MNEQDLIEDAAAHGRRVFHHFYGELEKVKLAAGLSTSMLERVVAAREARALARGREAVIQAARARVPNVATEQTVAAGSRLRRLGTGPAAAAPKPPPVTAAPTTPANSLRWKAPAAAAVGGGAVGLLAGRSERTKTASTALQRVPVPEAPPAKGKARLAALAILAGAGAAGGAYALRRRRVDDVHGKVKTAAPAAEQGGADTEIDRVSPIHELIGVKVEDRGNGKARGIPVLSPPPGYVYDPVRKAMIPDESDPGWVGQDEALLLRSDAVAQEELSQAEASSQADLAAMQQAQQTGQNPAAAAAAAGGAPAPQGAPGAPGAPAGGGGAGKAPGAGKKAKAPSTPQSIAGALPQSAAAK